MVCAIYNEEFPHPPIPLVDIVPGPIPTITISEVMRAIHKMNSKSPGPDNIPAEVWKLLGEHGTDMLTELFAKITREGNVPQVWTTSVTVAIWKGNVDIGECSNYHPIQLLCHCMKIFERVLDAHLCAIVSMMPNQCGFVQGKGTNNAIFAMRLPMEKHCEKYQPLHLAFLNMEKAFDCIPNDLI